MNEELTLKHHIATADIHASRLAYAVGELTKMLACDQSPFTNPSLETIALLDMMSTRFSKLQDLIGSKIFPLIFEITGESGITLIDKLNKLEKLDYINDSDWWMELRKLRNIMTHDYPHDDVLITSTIERLYSESIELLDYWNELKFKLGPLTKPTTL